MNTSQPEQNAVRRNGFQQPLSSAQLSTWVALPTLVIEYLIVVTPVLPWQASIPCTLVFGVTAVLAAYYAYKATVTDSMDDYLKKYLKDKEEARKRGETISNGNSFGGCLGGIDDPAEPLKHCWICETQVAEHAMHCKFCNKCIGNFDHHCMWLNTCVGKANYPFFWLTMVWITIMLVVHMVVQAVLVLDIFANLGGTLQRAGEWFNVEVPNVVAGIFIAFVVFDFVALSLILQLLAFHIKLQKEGLTTYRFIVKETQRKREEKKKEVERQNKRIVAMGKANDEGKSLLALRLQCGRYVACCDPLPPDVEAADKETKQQTNAIDQSSSSQSSQQPTPGATLPLPPCENDVPTSNENGSTVSNGTPAKSENFLSVALTSVNGSTSRFLPEDVPCPEEKVPFPPTIEECVEASIRDGTDRIDPPEVVGGVTFLPVGE